MIYVVKKQKRAYIQFLSLSLFFSLCGIFQKSINYSREEHIIIAL